MSARKKDELIDLASEDNGGRALVASDEFFAPKENLLKPGQGRFIPGRYTDRGKWMDGWETRRRRTGEKDWCIIRLGVPGNVQRIDISTKHFSGNHPSHASVDGCVLPRFTPEHELRENHQPWVEILPRSKLEDDANNSFSIRGESPFTHIRLNIYPDGGVARFRVYGKRAVIDDGDEDLVDVASEQNGGRVLACSDMQFGDMENLIKPGPARDMREGWETRRRRGPGNDWVILRLGSPSRIHRIVVDTLHFKGNYPDSCSIEGCFSSDVDEETWLQAGGDWREILPRTKLKGHTENFFVEELKDAGRCSHVRLLIYPDGGVSRLRVYGKHSA